MNSVRKTPTAKMITGIRMMLWPAGCSALVATIVYSVEGEAMVAEGRSPLWQLLGIYVVIAVTSGAALGLLEEHTKTLVGRALSYIVVALPLTIVIASLANNGGVTAFSWADLIIAVAMAAFIGPAAAAFQSMFEERRRR